MNPKWEKPVWTDIGVPNGPQEWEWQGPHAYYKVHLNKVTGHFQLGRRLLPTNPIHLVGTFRKLTDAQAAAEAREAAL